MKKTLVPLPGFVEDSKVGLLIDSFDNLITVLPTKTKPKRIMLVRQIYFTYNINFLH